MSAKGLFPRRWSRRAWVAFTAVTPVFSQITSSVPPQGAPAAAPPSLTPEAKMQKSLAEVRSISERLAQIEVPMDVEPAFSFKA